MPLPIGKNGLLQASDQSRAVKWFARSVGRGVIHARSLGGRTATLTYASDCGTQSVVTAVPAVGRNRSLPSYYRRVSTLLGPLGSFRNFVSMIVLPNVCDYDREQKRLAEGLSKDSTRRELTRRLFNAVVALDSAVDHYYHDVNPGTSLQDFLKTLPPEIAQLRELSNAMKHCVRGTEKKGVFTVADGKAHAKDIAKTHIEGSVTIENGVPVVQLTFSSTLLEGADELLGSAFRYWVSHL